MLPSFIGSPRNLQERDDLLSTAKNLNDAVSAEIVGSKDEVKFELPKSQICQHTRSNETSGDYPLSDMVLSSSCLPEKILPVDKDSAHLRVETAAILNFETSEKKSRSIDETLTSKFPDPVLPPAEDAQVEVTRPIFFSQSSPLEVDETGSIFGISTASLSDTREAVYVSGSSLTANDPAPRNDVYTPLSQTKNDTMDVSEESKGNFLEIEPVNPLAAQNIRHIETSVVTIPAVIETESSSVEELSTCNDAPVVEITSIISNSTLQFSCKTHQQTFAPNLPVSSAAAARPSSSFENGAEIMPNDGFENPTLSLFHSSASSLSSLVDEIRYPNLAPNLPVKLYVDRKDHTSLEECNSIKKITAERGASVFEISPLSCLGFSTSTPPNSFESCQSTPAPSLSKSQTVATLVPENVENISEATTVNQVDFVPESRILPNPSVSSATSSLEISQQTLGPSLPVTKEDSTSTSAKRSHNPEPDSLGQFDTPTKPKKCPRISPKPPAPTGTSATSQKLAYIKLALPFRSPLLQRHLKSPNTEAARHTPQKCEDYNSSKSTSPGPSRPVTSVITPKAKQLTRLRGDAHLPPYSGSKSSKAVSRQFKSPFKSPLSSLSSSTTQLVTSPNIQVLERKLQILRRAVRIRADRDEEKLQRLTAKWRSVGREVAWEMWAIVREQGENNGWTSDANDKKMGNKPSGWGWDDTNVKCNATWNSLKGDWGFAEYGNDQAHLKKEAMDRNGMEYMELDFNLRTTTADETEKSTSVREVEMYDEEVSREIQDDNEDDRSKEERHNTLGTMLREFGIADETLGWNEDEEDFLEVKN